MASRKTSLGHYVQSRKKKYTRGERYLIHVSNSPHKILIPQITTYAYQTIVRDEKRKLITCDYERFHPYVYLSPPARFADWGQWCAPIFSKGNTHGYVTLYAHLVKVNVKDLKVLKNRYRDELVSSKSLAVERIIPFRYHVNKIFRPVNRDAVLRKLDQLKKPYKYTRAGQHKITQWFMRY